MLQWINDRMKVIGWIFILPLALVFAVWGVGGIVDFSSRQEKGLRVNGEDVNLEQLRLAYQERLAQAARVYPDDVPAPVRANIKSGIVDEFVSTALLNQKVKELRYTVSDRDVVQSIQRFQGFQVAGRFNKDAYYSLLKARGYTPERFEAEQRQLLVARTLEAGVVLSAFATPAELERAAALKGETREVAYAVIPVAKFVASASPDAAAVKAYYDAHQDEFKTPETVHLSYVALRVGATANEVAVDEAGLKAYYDTVKDRFVEAEKRRARHILIQPGSDEAAAKRKADEVYALASKPGADFAALARQYSQDAGSVQQGGDLGLVEKSFFVGAFADAVFSMKPGEIRGPVKTQFGWHVIKLEAIEAGQSKSFEQARAELEPEYRKTEAERRFGERQEKLEQLAFEQNGSLEPVAKALGLKIEELPSFYKGLAGNELAANAKVLQAAFGADVLAGQNSRPLELSPGNVVVIRATDHKIPELQALEAVRARAEEGARRELAARSTAKAAEQLVASLAAGEPWERALKPLGAVATPTPEKPAPATTVRFAAAKFIGRAEAGVPPVLLSAVFTAKPPAPGTTTSASARLPNGDTAVFAVTTVKAGVPKADGGAERREIANTIGEADFAAYLAQLRARSDVHYSPAIFE